MPSFCAVLNCNRYGHSENISFHKFPLKRNDLLKSWESFIQKQRGACWRASRWSSLCSRHFRDDDFRSLNERKTLKKSAVPSILECKDKSKDVSTEEDKIDRESKEIQAIREQLEDVGSSSKTNCRLCGVNSVPVVTFATNYELYGILQKCFPNLNIKQEDSLPKELCSHCYKNLQHYGEFVDIVWAAQAELQRKYRSRAVEKPLKIKQEPLVRVKQEVAEIGYDQQQELIGNDDYEVIADGTQDEGDDSVAVDQKYEFCDFPIINDCDIMEIINLDDPFINIPDDDNTTTINGEHELQKPISDDRVNHLSSAHELLQAHLLMDEHNYAYVDTDDFKEERQVYKTEKSDNDERLTETVIPAGNISHGPTIYEHCNSYSSLCSQTSNTHSHNISESITSAFENRALKPIVTSVSAIQQPTKANGIVVLNESIVKSGAGFQLHMCMVCQLKFFSIASLKEHYTQTHGTPMVTVPTANIVLEKTSENACKTETEIIENPKGLEDCGSAPEHVLCKSYPNINDSQKQLSENNEVFKMDTMAKESEKKVSLTKSMGSLKSFRTNTKCKSKLTMRQRNLQVRNANRKNQHISLNTMATQYIQLKKLYQTLQKKCLNLEQNVEQLQLLPSAIKTTTTKPKLNSRNINVPEIKYVPQSATKSPLHSCPVCFKIFSNSNSLSQHKITHTEERKHMCSLCQRSFKRRNGLNQHMKGFHLKVKPFVCHVCNHSYSLKNDMLRCKHSTLRTIRSTE